MDMFNKLFKGTTSDPSDVSFGDNGKGRPIYDFDPSGLERAAKSAHELKNNPHAEKVLEVAILEANNKRLNILKDQKALELKIEQSKMDAIKQQHEYAVDILKEEAKTHRTKAEYEDFLARKRQEDRMEIDKKSQLEFLKIQEESVKRQEELKKQTIDYEFGKRMSNEKELSAAFWKNKAAYKKEIKEIDMEKYTIKMANDLKAVAIYADTFASSISQGFRSLYEDKTKFLSFTFNLCVLAGGLVIVRRGLTSLIRQAEIYYTTPKLVKESNVRNIFAPSRTTSSFNVKTDLASHGLIYNKPTESCLMDVIRSTQASIINKGNMRNFLFYGPPGTGKTLFAKTLAMRSSLNYAIMTGGDVLPLKEKAVTELNKVFDWSNRKKGLILFLDEADAFLKKRGHVQIGEEMRSALNAFLYRTGGSSQKLLLILATNKPEQLDGAVTDRIDMLIEFPLPDEYSRKKLFDYYFKQYLVGKVDMDENMPEIILDELVVMSNGFSAREIAKLCLSWQVSALSNTDKKLSREFILKGLKNMSLEHSTKKLWEKQTCHFDDLNIS